MTVRAHLMRYTAFLYSYINFDVLLNLLERQMTVPTGHRMVDPCIFGALISKRYYIDELFEQIGAGDDKLD